MRVEQYLTFTDHVLWEVTVNGDSVTLVASTSAGAKGPIPPKTAKQKLARKNELKAKSTLMLAIPDEHLLKFHACKDAKSLWEAIKNRFRGNKESNKMQKTILKQNYKNLAASNLEQIDAGDLEEIDLKWQVAMHTMRVKRRGHFARECRALSNQVNRNIDASIRNAPEETSTTKSLVVQDKIAVVLIKSGQVPVNAAKQSSHRAASSVSAARRVNTAATRPNMNDALPTTYSYFKTHSPIIKKLTVDLLHFEEMLKEVKLLEKKNNVLFTDTECVVLSPDFKLLDESQVLLKVPINNNMYSFDLKNVVPLGGLTCLFAKATLDESNLWPRRLGHINFKTMNKLVRENLVRGLPSKLFGNNPTCVACHKGKKHKASCKTKTVADDAGKKGTKVPRKENEVQDPTKEGRERAQRNELKIMFVQDIDSNGNSTYRIFTPISVVGSSYGIFISQDKYVADILKKFDFSSLKTASTLIETNKALLKDDEAEEVDVHLYRSMIGSLMYLTASRPGIMFVVCACARFQVTPKVSHIHAVKRIFRYLKGQPKLGLWYLKDSPFNLEAFLDSDYAGASLDRKSTTGGC
nr:uncharacterized mitochondrial protein AtMg00810-like [Tanacetum cinerariifolium]